MHKEIPIRERLWDRYYTGAPRTTEVTRRAIQKRQESLKALSERYETNHKTVATWRKRDVVPMRLWGRSSRTRRCSHRRKKRCAWGLSQIYSLTFG